MSSQKETDAFKNWINKDLIERMAQHIQFHFQDFDKKNFIAIHSKLFPLELKARVHLIRDQLHKHLPEDFQKSITILLKAVDEPAPQLKPLHGFDLWPITEYVQTFGLKQLEISLQTLHRLTPKFTAEFAVRPFLIYHEKETLKVLSTWAKDPNHHVRRLVSEGSRPRLPWGELLRNFIAHPQPTLKLLEKLKYDEELYVRKSVANHLNDISKDHPEIAIATLRKWNKEAPKKHQTNIQWITRHGLRTLIKKGHKDALGLLGFDVEAPIVVKKVSVTSQSIKRPQSLEFSLTLEAPRTVDIVVDYAIHYQKANGRTSPKVFKLTNKHLEAKSQVTITKKHSFKPVTTRKLYPGIHYLEILINGQSRSKIKFNLL